MSGLLAGTVTAHRPETPEAHPDLCPLKDQYHLPSTPCCQRVDTWGAVLTCPYLISLTEVSNAMRRRHITATAPPHQDAERWRVGILCGAARRNRPPGC